MTKRDSLLAGFTYPSSSMSMPRRLSWRSRDHGHSSSTAAPSDSLHPSRSDTAPTAPNAGPSIAPAGSGDYASHYGYSSADLATPIPTPADHQAPILPHLAGETYPLQREMAEVRRQLHAYYFVEVQTPQDDNSQPALRRLMVTEVDRRGNHHNRQPEYFFNGIIGHIRAGQNGWIDSWDQSSQLANYSPTTGVAISRFRRSPHMEIGIPILMQLQKALLRCKNPAWKTLIPSLPTWTLLHLPSRFISWQRSSGTFSTMTGMPTWPYSNVSRILMMTFPDTRFRSSRRQIWLTLPVTWRNPHERCRSKPVAWRHFPTRPCEL